MDETQWFFATKTMPGYSTLLPQNHREIYRNLATKNTNFIETVRAYYKWSRKTINCFAITHPYPPTWPWRETFFFFCFYHRISIQHNVIDEISDFPVLSPRNFSAPSKKSTGDYFSSGHNIRIRCGARTWSLFFIFCDFRNKKKKKNTTPWRCCRRSCENNNNADSNGGRTTIMIVCVVVVRWRLKNSFSLRQLYDVLRDVC